MITYTSISKPTQVPTSIKCDVCGTSYAYKSGDDRMEIQEFLCIDHKGGYGSIFGDPSSIKCDICQHCLKRLLGKYLRISVTYLYI